MNVRTARCTRTTCSPCRNPRTAQPRVELADVLGGDILDPITHAKDQLPRGRHRRSEGQRVQRQRRRSQTNQASRMRWTKTARSESNKESRAPQRHGNSIEA
jgi:hypothetical protein